MRYVAISRRLPGADPQRIAALALDEARAAWALYRSGVARELAFDTEQSKGVLMLEAADRAAARAALAALPLVQLGQIDFDLFALGPYTQLEQLFAA